MSELSQYTNNMFVTHADMATAMQQAADIASGSDNAAAVLTAVMSVLNTAIKIHTAEMAKANMPLIELIDARVAAAVSELRSEIDESNLSVDARIEAAIDDIDLDAKVQDWMDNNFDLEDALSGVSVRINFD